MPGPTSDFIQMLLSAHQFLVNYLSPIYENISHIRIIAKGHLQNMINKNFAKFKSKIYLNIVKYKNSGLSGYRNMEIKNLVNIQ
jgi:hypothetical protein